jgi:streptothricin acetyltransferase
MPLPPPSIRPLTEADIPRLEAIRPGFVSDTALVLERSGSGLEVDWRLVERPLDEPFDKGGDYDFDTGEQRNIRQRLRRGDGLQLVVEWQDRLVGVLDAAPERWNHTALVWNLMLDQTIRRQGIGRELFERATAWARQGGFRALVCETQTNNVAACRFYLAMGCELEGIRTALYTNHDLARGEVALFWIYPLRR